MTLERWQTGVTSCGTTHRLFSTVCFQVIPAVLVKHGRTRSNCAAGCSPVIHEAGVDRTMCAVANILVWDLHWRALVNQAKNVSNLMQYRAGYNQTIESPSDFPYNVLAYTLWCACICRQEIVIIWPWSVKLEFPGDWIMDSLGI